MGLNQAALDSFITKKYEIDQALEKLQTLSEEHFNIHPDDIDWGHVSTLEHYASLLKQITDIAFRKGEHS